MDNTDRVVNSFVRLAVTQFSPMHDQQAVVWDTVRTWERGSDGHFRPVESRVRNLFPLRVSKDLSSMQGYEACKDALKANLTIGPQLDCLVGTAFSMMRIEAEAVLWSLIAAMVDEDGILTFSDERFEKKWLELCAFFAADTLTYKTVAPLPHLSVKNKPFNLGAEIVLDALSADEVSRCAEVGVLSPASLRFPMMGPELAVGLRATWSLPKIVLADDAIEAAPDQGNAGSFGSRPPLQSHLVVEDVLSALRIFKRSGIRAAGEASWHVGLMLNGDTSFRCVRRWPYGGAYVLTDEEVPRLQNLWHQLENSSAELAFSIRRFNLAFDRDLVEDRIVDLVVAAESLFLGELDVRDRGELRYRFALRSAKFIEHPAQSQREVFRVMQRAYDARSSVVHGDLPRDTRVFGNQAAGLAMFTDEIEELVRLGLRKALTLAATSNNLRTAKFWDDLVLGNDD